MIAFLDEINGLAARALGAERQTSDVDCVPNSTVENLERMAAALVELDGRLRVGGMSDEEARSLPVTIDAEVGDLTVLLASLDDIVASKEFAGRDKDRDALPELNELLRRQQSS